MRELRADFRDVAALLRGCGAVIAADRPQPVWVGFTESRIADKSGSAIMQAGPWLSDNAGSLPHGHGRRPARALTLSAAPNRDPAYRIFVGRAPGAGKMEQQVGAGIIGWGLRAVLRAYQLLVSPLLPPSCRFLPSCSEYAAEAIERHGAVRGIGLAVRRLARCHPWGGSGYDPVPDPRAFDTRGGGRGRHAPCAEPASADPSH